MNNLVYVGSLCPGEEFFYRGKHYRFHGLMIRNYRERVACYEAGTSGNRLDKDGRYLAPYPTTIYYWMPLPEPPEVEEV